MRNIPVDVTKFTFVCVSQPRPKLVSQETGEVKLDREGRPLFTVGLSAADEFGRVDLVNVALSVEPEIGIGQVVVPVGLIASAWESEFGGRMRSGVAFRATDIVPAAPVARTG